MLKNSGINFGSNKKSIFPPINANNNVSYSIKEEINISGNKSKSRMGSSGKKGYENNNMLSNFNNKSSRKNNNNFDNKEDDDEDYGEGDFENNISSLNQTSGKKQVQFGKIRNQNEKSISIQEKINKSKIDNNKEEVEESYGGFDDTKGLINKGVNLEGSSGFNNNAPFKI